MATNSINLGRVKGDPFTFDDFTPEQLATLKGEKGETPIIKVGTVETLDSEESATVTASTSGTTTTFNFGIPRGENSDASVFNGTQAEYEAMADTIEDGTIVNIIDDLGDGALLGEDTLRRVADLEVEVGALSDNVVYLTQAEYDALPDSKLTNGVEYRITDANASESTASNLAYDNTHSGIGAVNVQGAIDELSDSLDKLIHNRSFTSNEVSIDAQGYHQFEIPLNIPSGYTPLCFARINIANIKGALMGYRIDIANSKAYIVVHNPSDTASPETYVYGYVVCVKDVYYAGLDSEIEQ